MKILLIEDDPQFVKIVEAAVATLPTELIHCATGKAGLRRVAQRDIDLCIVDGVLPDKQGVRVIEEIKAMRAFTEPRVVFLSAFFKDVRTFRKLTALGVDLVLSKPIQATDLKQKLSVFMPKAAAKPESADAAGFAAAFARMKEDYVEKLRLSRAPEFEVLIARAERDDTRAIDEIRSFCHKLRGTAGSYGLAHITEAAARLENGVDYHQLSRLLPEMRAFLALLQNASLDASKPPVEPTSDVGLATLFRSLLIVSDSPVVYTRVSRELADEKLDARQATTLEEAMHAVVHVEPDLLIIDTAMIDDHLDKPVIEALIDYRTEIPILAFGAPIHALPDGVASVPMTALRQQLVEALQSQEMQPFRDTTALLCDEHDNVARQVDELLPALGVSVQRCTSAQNLLSTVGAGVPQGAAPGALPDEIELPDVIIMDIDFVNRSGIDLINQIRADSDEPPRVIFLSDQTTLAERSQSYQAGAAGYVLKPLANEQLSRAVTRVLRQRRTARFVTQFLPTSKHAARRSYSTSRTTTLTLTRSGSVYPGAGR